jgi:hypothetical protein
MTRFFPTPGSLTSTPKQEFSFPMSFALLNVRECYLLLDFIRTFIKITEKDERGAKRE